ncbi:thioesterase family protein [Streptosporangium sp. G11]|uniref:thioesterase family protein n=1 Tax=Streptosporangium sp. G11 TaxID=3436926 RepID=UPI003EB6D47F
MTLDTSFALTPTGSGFQGLAGEEWMFAGRVFGGFLAAFAAKVAMNGAPGLTLGGIHGCYPQVAAPGRLDGRLEVLRQGKSAQLVRVDLLQQDALVFTGHVWLLDPRLTAAGPDAEAPEPDAPRIHWLEDEVAFFKNFDILAIDYPLSPGAMGDGVPRCEVWARVRPELIGEQIHESLVDLLLYDCFLLECVFRSEGIGPVQPVTLDLETRWIRHAPPGAWRRVVTEAVISDGIALANGTSHTVAGKSLSMATSQGRLFRRD